VTFAFSEDVGGFTADDIEITNGTYSSFQSEAGSPSNLYSADIVPSGNGTVEISVPSGVAQNADGELNQASNIFTTNYQGFNHGRITEVIPGTTDDKGYAIDYSNGDLLVLDLTKPGIVEKISLKHNNPVSAVIDQHDGSLYILDKAPYLDVYDTTDLTAAPTTLALSDGYFGQDLGLNSSSNKLYILKREGTSGDDCYLDSIDITDPSNLSTNYSDTALVDKTGSSIYLLVNSDQYHSLGMAVASSADEIYIMDIGTSWAELYKYDSAGDFLQQYENGAYGQMLDINKTETALVHTTNTGNNSDTSYDVFEYNLSVNYVDQWHLDGKRPYAALFSHDSKRLYLTDQDSFTDGTLYIFDATSSNSLITTHTFPRSYDYSRLAESIDGTTVIGASCKYDGTYNRIFYFDVP